MDITVAYFHPLLHPHTVKHDFEQIRAVGAGSIVYTVHEQEEQRWSRDLDRGFQQAQDAGLKVHVSLGCYGNLFGGPSLMPSWYTFRHPQSRVMDRHGHHCDITCFNHEAFRSWLFAEIEHLLSMYPINGILIDGRCGSDITCFCSVCRALCPDITDLQHFRRRSLINFLDALFACIKRVEANVKTSFVLLPQDLYLVDELAALPQLDTIGCQLFWQLLGEDVAMVEEWGRIVVEATRRYDKRSQLWLQNFSLDEQSEPMLLPVFAKMLSAEPDEVACYYYWRNNENPERVWQMTHELLRCIPRRQLHWQATLSSVPVPQVPHISTG